MVSFGQNISTCQQRALIHAGTEESPCDNSYWFFFDNFLLRKYAKQIGYLNCFTIADQSDSEDILAIFREEIEKKQRKYLPKKEHS